MRRADIAASVDQTYIEYARKNFLARLCVQRRLARSAGDSPAKAKARSLVAWMAGRRETNDLKPIDRVIVRMTASHRAAAQANAQVAPKVMSPGGRVRNLAGC